MISSFDKYIKAAVDAKKYDVVCEMANVIYPERHINIMTYPGDSVRVYKNREDEVQVLCPKNISVVQESNLTKSISTGTIFDDADNVDNHADFIVGTKMPTTAMNNKGLENPYKLKEVVGSTIGAMDDDGRVDVSDTDVENGKNVIDDLLEKDSKEFKDVKNVVDDYLGNDDHSFGYDKDFTMDIQQLRDEIQRFKDSDISPEDSIQDSDWDDNWGSTTSIMDDDDDDKENPDTSKDKDDDEDEDDDHEMDISDDDDDQKESDDDDESVEESFGYRLKGLDAFIEFDVDDADEDISMEEYFAFLDTPPEDLFQESVIHSVKTLSKLGYDPKTKTFITDIPSVDGKDKLRCKLQIGGIVYGGPLGLTQIRPTGPTFYTPPETPEPLLYVPLSVMLKGGKDLLSLLKHEEGHFYISTNRANFNRDFARARKLVDKHSSKLSDHGNVPEEYVADLYSANQTGVENTVKMLKNLGFKSRKGCAKLKLGLNHKWVTRFMKQLRRYENYDSYNPVFAQMKEYATKMKQCVSNTKEMVDYVTEIHGITKAGPGAYASRLNNMDTARVSALQAGRAVEKSVVDTSSIVSSIMKTIERQSKLDSLTFDDWEKMLHASINEVHKRIDEFKEATDYEIRARIAFIRKYGNKPTQESVTPTATMSNPNTNTTSPNTPPPAYKTNQQSAQPKMLNTNNNNGANTDTNDVDYKQKEDEEKAKLNANPSDGSNVNTTMEEDTTTPMPMFSAGAAVQTESNKIKDVDPDDLNSAPSDNRAPIIGAAFKQEAFGLKRPKKLKAIPVRDIVAYVTVEMNAIKDSNDQAMLSGYVCSKLELIDFYLNVIDTNDDRYVVPHTRQYLVDGQKQLTDLLTRILRIKPINRSERIWKINLPDNM